MLEKIGHAFVPADYAAGDSILYIDSMNRTHVQIAWYDVQGKKEKISYPKETVEALFKTKQWIFIQDLVLQYKSAI